MVDENNFGSSTQGYICYEQLKAMDDVIYFGSWAQASRCDE